MGLETRNLVKEKNSFIKYIPNNAVLESGLRFTIATIQAEITKKIEFSQKIAKLKMKGICLLGKYPT